MSDDAWRRRAVATGIKPRKIAGVMSVFSAASRIEGVHPLQCGVLRVKARTQRRHGMPIVNSIVFYPLRAVEFVTVVAKWLSLGLRYHKIKKRAVADPSSANYVDDATRVSPLDGTEDDDFVAAFADKIPNTHGAPKRQPVAAS
jgi:hypothetical protein